MQQTISLKKEILRVESNYWYCLLCVIKNKIVLMLQNDWIAGIIGGAMPLIITFQGLMDKSTPIFTFLSVVLASIISFIVLFIKLDDFIFRIQARIKELKRKRAHNKRVYQRKRK